MKCRVLWVQRRAESEVCAGWAPELPLLGGGTCVEVAQYGAGTHPAGSDCDTLTGDLLEPELLSHRAVGSSEDSPLCVGMQRPLVCLSVLCATAPSCGH